MTTPDFAPPPSGTTLANGRGDVGAAESVLREPSGPTIPLNKLAPEAALRRLELTVVLANADRDRLVSKYGKEILKT